MKRSGSRALLLLIASTLGLVACATTTTGDPMKESSPSISSAAATPVVVILDGSESMLTADAPGPRMDAARSAVTTFVKDLEPQTPFGLVVYGTTKSAKTTGQATGCTDVTTAVPLAPINKTEAVDAINGVQAVGWTPLSAALTRSVEMLGANGGSVVLVSDGEATCPPDPCETARSLRGDRPHISISTIGFKSSQEQLGCIAREGGGIFVTADNAAQLSSRLRAARESESAAKKLTNTGLAGINIGDSEAEIRNRNPSFPAVSSGTREGDRLVVRWIDCDWVFDGPTLVEIRPLTVSTVDDIEAGTSMRRVIELFGEPVKVETGSSTAYFTADESRELALRVVYSGDVTTGTVATIVLCKCLPKRNTASPQPSTGTSTTTSLSALCAARKAVNDIFQTKNANVINHRSPPEDLEAVATLGETAKNYPAESIQYEGSQIAEAAEAEYLTIAAFNSKQNIKAVCRR